MERRENNYVVDEGYNREVRAADHNMILFDGKGYSHEGRHNIFKKVKKDQFAAMEETEITDDFVYTVANLKNVYDKSSGVSLYKRHFLYTCKDSLIIFDELISERAQNITWQIHSEEELIYENGSFRSWDRNFRLTPIIKHDCKISRDTRVITAILNRQEPEEKDKKKNGESCLQYKK